MPWITARTANRRSLWRRTVAYDAAVVDLMLPKLDGLSLIQQLRAGGVRMPVLILSAKASVDDRVKGLQAGGDDYLTKPFAFSELLARVQALIRRATQTAEPTRLSAGDLTLDLLTREVRRGGETVELQPREFALLEYLMRIANRAVTKTMILEHIFDYSFDPQTNVVDVLVHRLRSKADPDKAVDSYHSAELAMSFDLLKTARRNIGLRLGLWYAFVFALSSVALLTSPTTCRGGRGPQRPGSAASAPQGLCGQFMRAADCPRLRDAMQQEAGGSKTFFIRLVNPWNDVSFANVPDDWIAFKDIPSGLAGYRQQVGVLRIPKDAEKDFVIASMPLPDNFAAAGWPQHGQPRRRCWIRCGATFILVRQRHDSFGLSRRRVFCPSRHAPRPPDCGHRPLHHSHRPARRARSGAQIATMNWMNWSACSTRCSTRTSR